MASIPLFTDPLASPAVEHAVCLRDRNRDTVRHEQERDAAGEGHMRNTSWGQNRGLASALTLCWSLVVASCAPPSEVEAAIEAPQVPVEIADGLLSVIIFPVLDEPFIAPNMNAGALPWRGGAEHFQGVDIDLMVGFAEELGVDVEFVRLKDVGFGSLLPALAKGHGDAVASAVTITEEREQLIDFSRPYFEISIVVVTATDSTFRSIDDLAGKTGVGVRGSRPITVLRDLGFAGEMIEADFQTGAYSEVAEGIVDFAIMESASAVTAVRETPDLEIAFSLPAREDYGVAIAKGSALRSSLNAYLDRIEADGTLASIIQSHLGAS